MNDEEWALMLDTVNAFEVRLSAAILELDGMEDPSSLSEIIALGQAIQAMRGAVDREKAVREDARKGGYIDRLLDNQP